MITGNYNDKYNSYKTFAEAADTLVALMDSLNINEFAVLAVSAGGPTGYQVALRHQHRVKCLITECAITGAFNHPMAG